MKPINLSVLTGKLLEMAKPIAARGGDKNAIDSIIEFSLFKAYADTAKKNGQITAAEFNSVFDVKENPPLDKKTKVEVPDRTRNEIVDSRIVEANIQAANSKKALQTKSSSEVSTTDLIKKVAIGNVDLPYWSERIDKFSKEYDLPREIIIAIIARETNRTFEKNSASDLGKGPMGITTAAVNAFFPTAKGNWNDYYKDIDNKLLQDCLYRKDDLSKLRYSTSKALKDACAKDDEYGIKIGILTFKMKYVQAIGSLKYGKKPLWRRPEYVIKDFQNEKVNLTPSETKECVRNAIRNYNSSNIKEAYTKEVMEMLEKMNFDFSQDIITI